MVHGNGFTQCKVRGSLITGEPTLAVNYINVFKQYC
jgi:hypothetical protein